MRHGLRIAALAATLAGAGPAQAVTFATGYTQNFDTLASTGTGTAGSRSTISA